jgi:hypothetical protein
MTIKVINMASEITLKYLHPSIKTYITTENYKYDTSVRREVLFVADVFDHGKDNVLQEVNTLSEYLFKYGTPNLKKFGQAGYNVERWLTNGGSAVIMRLLPEDASYAHAVLNIQYKNATNGKTVIDANGNDTKINDVYLRPLVAYIGVNNTSEKLLESELAEDRTGYPTTDGYIDNFIFAVYPEGRGEYYNDLGFRIRLNPSYDGVLTSRVYTFEVIRYTSDSTFDIIDGPYFVTFDPDAIDPNSQKSMFIENVVNSYSDYIKVKFNTDNYIKLASVINDEVDPYIIDVISGQSRILPSGERETYFSTVTNKDEDVHVSLRKYSSNGIALQENGDYILNISNNDETTSDIVDIADNSRRVIYNNQKYVTDYMRGYYNWLIQDRIPQNLNKIIAGNIESGYLNMGGLLLDKVENLIYANEKNSDLYTYSYDNAEFSSKYVGRKTSETVAQNANNAWYLRTQEIINPGLKNKEGKYVGSKIGGVVTTGYENGDQVFTSTSEMAATITPDGYIEKTNQHLISYYHNFMKYIEFVTNYDVYNNCGFVISEDYLNADKYFESVDDEAPLYAIYSSNGSTDLYKNIYHLDNGNLETIKKENFLNEGYTSIFDMVLKNLYGDKIVENGGTRTAEAFWSPVGTAGIGEAPENAFSYAKEDENKIVLYPMFIDDTYTDNDLYIPIINLNTYNEDGIINVLGDYIKVVDIVGNTRIQPIKGTTLSAGSVASSKYLRPYILDYLYNISTERYNDNGVPAGYTDNYCVINTAKPDTSKINIEINTDITQNMTDLGNFYSVDGYYKFLYNIVNHFDGDINYNDYLILVDGNNGVIADVENYNDYKAKKDNLNYIEIKLTDVIKFVNAIIADTINVEASTGRVYYPNSTNKFNMVNISLTAFDMCYDKIIGPPEKILKTNVGRIITDFYFKKDNIGSGINVFNSVFDERLKNGKLTNSFNKVNSYASLISKELDGKGKDTIIDDITTKKIENLDYSDYSLTTMLNVFVGGFESIVNNMGSVTDYSNYSSLKYLMKTVNNNLDLRSTYLTLLNVHKNNILDLSTDLAKANASVILGEETLETLYSAMDTVVAETNYLITNIIFTILNKTYTIYDLETMYKATDGTTPYTYYFSDNIRPDGELKYNEIEQIVDPLGINNNLNNYGKKDDNTRYVGILPLLEKILINITGQNHYGENRDPIYGGQALISIYDDIKNGYVLGGLTQERYETIYKILSESLAQLIDIHSIINVLVNEKYITDIINTLIGTIDIKNTIIKYNGSTYSVNTLWDFYNSDANNGQLTQTDVVNLINNSLKISLNTQPLPLNNEEADSDPVINYPYSCKTDIEDTINIAKDNKDIVQNNINKQDRVLASLNTLCYDNLVTNVTAPLSLMEGSDGSFAYDDSTTAALKARQHRINDIRIKAYKGTWNEDVLNKDLFEFDHILDANYEDPVKNAIVTLARDERQDFFYWADTKIQNTVQDAIDWKTGFTNQTYFMSIISQSQVWYDEYTSRNINLTSTYLIADMLCRHIDSYGIHYPMAGSRRGVVGGFISNDWYPNEEQKEKLYKNKINYLEKDITTIRIGSQNTNYPTGPLGQINNMLVLLRIKRTVEKIAKTYQFEFNTADTRSAMAAEINVYLGNWINNGACTVATATVYASDYDIIQKIVRVDVTLQFTGVIERIVINIDCPASI